MFEVKDKKEPRAKWRGPIFCLVFFQRVAGSPARRPAEGNRAVHPPGRERLSLVDGAPAAWNRRADVRSLLSGSPLGRRSGFSSSTSAAGSRRRPPANTMVKVSHGSVGFFPCQLTG